MPVMPKSKGRKPKKAARTPRRSPHRRPLVDAVPIHPDQLDGARLSAPPWEAYATTVSQFGAPEKTDWFIERFPFFVRGAGTPAPIDINRMTCLAEMADQAGETVTEICEVMEMLAGGGLMAWDADTQSVLLTIPDDMPEDALPAAFSGR